MKTNKKGISLIVLAITIIVMIILAAAILLSVSGKNIINTAKEATNANDLANAKHVVAVAKGEWELGEAEGYTLKEYAESKLQEAGFAITGNGGIYVSSKGAVTTIYEDKDGYKTVIPTGFVASEATGENTIEYGLVIYEGTEPVTDKNVATARETRNQFVWVPVPDINFFKRTTTYDGETITPPESQYTEPYSYDNLITVVNDLTGEWAEYTAMYESVNEYGGFYIGRYETGTNVAPKNSGGNGTRETFIQKNKYAYEYVGWGLNKTSVVGDVFNPPGSSDNHGKGAVELSRAFCSTDEVQSTLCYGVQWDAALNFISTSGIKDKIYATNSKGKYWNYDNKDGNPKFLTGIDLGESAANRLNNIYDMAGNVEEWTMEASGNNGRVLRGGNRSYTISASDSKSDNVYDASHTRGFRIALYLK